MLLTTAFQGAQGDAGGPGPTGPAGPTPTGPTGPQGSQGPTGAQGAQGTSPGTGAQGAQGAAGPSDSRFKTNVRPIETPLSKIKLMRGVSFIWNKDVNESTRRDIGFVAQEIERVMPELVFKANASESAFYQVKYNEIIALCLEAIKEQSTLIDLREQKLEKLELMVKEKGLF